MNIYFFHSFAPLGATSILLGTAYDWRLGVRVKEKDDLGNRSIAFPGRSSNHKL